MNEDLEEAIEIICGLVAKDCANDGELDSMCSSTYADAMRFLAKHGKIDIHSEAGRRVWARWVKEEL
jgi:hypothetical protein